MPGEDPMEPAEAEAMKTKMQSWRKVAGWYLEAHGTPAFYFAFSLHKPRGDGHDDLLCTNLKVAMAAARENPLPENI